MKRRLILVCGGAVAVAALAFALAVSLFFMKPASAIGRQTAAPSVRSSGAASASSAPAAYTLKEYEGKIAVYGAGSDSPQQILDIPVASLPADEQAKLRAGVSVKDHEALLTYIENLSS